MTRATAIERARAALDVIDGAVRDTPSHAAAIRDLATAMDEIYGPLPPETALFAAAKQRAGHSNAMRALRRRGDQ